MLKFLPFLFMFLLSFSIHGNAQTPVEYPYRSCLAANFTPNSPYQSSLNLLLSNLSTNAPGINGFYNISVGRTPNDTVYGLFQCRGDQTNNTCRTCVAEGTRDIAQDYCPLRKAAVIWYDECIIRYSDQPFFSVVSTEPGWQLLNVGDTETDVIRSNQELPAQILRATASQAATGTSEGRMFATNRATFDDKHTLYTLAECTGDLSNSNCGECLREAVSKISICCLGKIGGRVLFPSCYVRYESYSFYNIPTTKTSVPTPSPRTPPPPGKSRSWKVIIIAIVAPISVCILVLALVGYCFLRRRAKKKKQTSAVKKDSYFGNEMSTVESLQFDFTTIEAATNYFSLENKLGEGGFGEVYKGKLDDGQEIAVKRLSKGSMQGSEEFKTEVLLVAKLQHKNLVTLLGFCLEAEEKLLVYEYIPNKSLDYFLFDPKRQRELDWTTRYRIICEVARGILYLHEDSRLRVIHRDLKASNILLDKDMSPKISDFGMARIVKVDQIQGNTNRIVGTYGYMSPEYAMHGQFSMKSDVYSYGVLILEIVSGKKNNSFYRSNIAEGILSYAWRLWKEGRPVELVDPNLRDSYSNIEVIRCIHIGLLCVQEDPGRRPSMASIALMLNRYSVTLPLPRHPAFIIRDEDKAIITASGSASASNQFLSINEISTVELYPR